MNFLGETMLILIIAIVVFVILAIVLFIIQKRLKKKIVIKEQIEQEGIIFKNKLEQLKDLKVVPQKTLDSLGELGRNFLKDAFKIEKNLDYSELIRLFQEKNKKNIASFCNEMLIALYSGDKVGRERLNRLIEEFEGIMSEQYPNLQKIRKPSPTQPVMPIEEKIPVKEEKPFTPPVEEEKPFLPLVVIPQRERILRQINSLDEEQIRDAYEELQKEFIQAYEIAEITRNEKMKEELEKFRKSMKKKIEDYVVRHKIIEFAQEISDGAKLISSFGTS